MNLYVYIYIYVCMFVYVVVISGIIQAFAEMNRRLLSLEALTSARSCGMRDDTVLSRYCKRLGNQTLRLCMVVRKQTLSPMSRLLDEILHEIDVDSKQKKHRTPKHLPWICCNFLCTFRLLAPESMPLKQDQEVCCKKLRTT